MDLKSPWVLGVAVALVLVLLAAWGWRQHRTDTANVGEAVLVARLARLRALPRFRSLARRRLLMAVAMFAAAAVTLGAAAVLIARPQETRVESLERTNRDVIFCLDASGSMSRWNVQVIRDVRSVIEELSGERIGMKIFSGVTVTVFPLTDDYQFVLDQLDVAESAFIDGNFDFIAGTLLDTEQRASQIGDGMASCAQGFDRPEDERARAVVLASDNDPLGRQLYTLDDAADLAVERGVVVHAIASPDTGPGKPAREFEAAVVRTGGTYNELARRNASDTIVDEIDALEATRIESPPEIIVTEDHELPTRFALGGGLALALLWVLQLVGRLRGRTR